MTTLAKPRETRKKSKTVDIQSITVDSNAEPDDGACQFRCGSAVHELTQALLYESMNLISPCVIRVWRSDDDDRNKIWVTADVRRLRAFRNAFVDNIPIQIIRRPNCQAKEVTEEIDELADTLARSCSVHESTHTQRNPPNRRPARGKPSTALLTPETQAMFQQLWGEIQEYGSERKAAPTRDVLKQIRHTLLEEVWQVLTENGQKRIAVPSSSSFSSSSSSSAATPTVAPWIEVNVMLTLHDVYVGREKRSISTCTLTLDDVSVGQWQLWDVLRLKRGVSQYVVCLVQKLRSNRQVGWKAAMITIAGDNVNAPIVDSTNVAHAWELWHTGDSIMSEWHQLCHVTTMMQQQRQQQQQRHAPKQKKTLHLTLIHQRPSLAALIGVKHNKVQFSHNNSVIFDNILTIPCNEEQRDAIAAFLVDNSDQKPLHLIQGPPGTGKTHMLAHLLLWLRKNRPSQRVLICTPSNQAIQRILQAYVSVVFDNVDLVVPHCVLLQATGERMSSVGQNHSQTTNDTKTPARYCSNTWITPLLSALSELEMFIWTRFGTTALQQSKHRNDQTWNKSLSDECRIWHARLSIDVQQPLDEYAFPFWTSMLQQILQRDVLDKLHYLADHVATLTTPQSILRSTWAYTTAVDVNQLLFAIQCVLRPALIRTSDDQTHFGLQSHLIRHSQFVFSTLGNIAHWQPSQLGVIDDVLIDEAGQSHPGETLLIFQACHPRRKVCLVGDPMQLQPFTRLRKKDTQQRSMASLLMYHWSNPCVQHTRTLLRRQYRMHPAICDWPNRTFYDNQLINNQLINNSDSKMNIQSTLGFSKQKLPPYALLVQQTNEAEEKCCISSSFQNRNEVSVATDIVIRLVRDAKWAPECIAVITFYSAQVECLRQSLNDIIVQTNADAGAVNWASSLRRIRIATVDSFQGQEADIVVVSFVRSNRRGQLGFVTDVHRLNVALTRAKKHLFLLADIETIEAQDSIVRDLVRDAESRECMHTTMDSLFAPIAPITPIAPIDSRDVS